MAPSSIQEKPHTERWGYQKLYTDGIFELCTRLYPLFHRPGFYAVSRSVALFYALTQPAIRQVVRENLALLESRPASSLAAIRVFLNFASTIADYVAVGAMAEKKARTLCLDSEDGLLHLREAIKDGKGAILATAHYSFFEFGAVVLSGMGIPLTVATLPEPTPELATWRQRWRERWKVETIEVGADPFSSLQVMRTIEGGRCMAMLVDRPMPEHGLPVTLPGGRILVSTSPALIAAITGCQIVPVVVVRLPRGRYRLLAKPPIGVKPTSRENRRQEIERATERMADSLFAEIGKLPEQWYQFTRVGI